MRINDTNHTVLHNIGGVISPEMELPKLMWIRESLPQSWQRIARVFDLTDYLTYRACGSSSRSLCTVGCKWTYQHKSSRCNYSRIICLSHEWSQGAAELPATGWDSQFFQQIGLGDLSCANIGSHVAHIGTNLGTLTAQSASDLGLGTHVCVSAGLIDAYAGALGLMCSLNTPHEGIIWFVCIGWMTFIETCFMV